MDAYSSEATLLWKVPIQPFTSHGVLRLADGRLTFTKGTEKRPGKVVLDAPVSQIHSPVAGAMSALYLWHGSRKYRFVPGPPQISGVATGNDALDLVTGFTRIRSARRANTAAQRARADWLDVLEPIVGTPPPGVQVGRPWPTWAWMLSIVAAALVFIAVILAYALMTS